MVAKGYQARRLSEWGQTIGIMRALGVKTYRLDDLEQKEN
jgi:hypothetical protein